MEKRADTSPQTSEEVIQQLNQQVAALKLQVAWYEEQFRRAQQKRFGASSEQTHPDQLALFNEAEAEASPKQPEPTLETVVIPRRKKAKGDRETKLANLPVETIHYTLEEAQCVCPDCAGPMHAMSTEVRKELKVIPAQVSVVEHVRHIYSCRCCEQTGVRTPIVTAQMPAPALPGSLSSPSMLAQIIYQKYVNSVPLYRQEAHAKLLEQDHAHADETTLQVLREAGRAAQTKSYLWLYRAGRGAALDVVLYDYRTGRGGEHPEAFLSGFTGYLQTDGYSGYAKVKGVTQLGC